MKTETHKANGAKVMKNPANTTDARREAQGSSVQSVQMNRAHFCAAQIARTPEGQTNAFRAILKTVEAFNGEILAVQL